jgi:hypothetical protein
METAGYQSDHGLTTPDPAGHRDRKTPGRNPAAHPPTGRHMNASLDQAETRRPHPGDTRSTANAPTSLPEQGRHHRKVAVGDVMVAQLFHLEGLPTLGPG